jgi:hypothetical protein
VKREAGRLGLKQFPARTTNSKQIFAFSKYNKFDYPARGGKITPRALPLSRSILIKTQKEKTQCAAPVTTTAYNLSIRDEQEAFSPNSAAKSTVKLASV